MTLQKRRRGRLAVLVGLTALIMPNHASRVNATEDYFGTAEVDITPTTAIRLSGYASRTTEATGVQQRIYAKAAAFGTDADTAIMISVDCTGVPDNVADVVSAALSQRLGIARERIVISSTHTHSGPCVHGYADNLFGGPLPPAQQQRINQYTAVLTDKLEEVALDALANRTPGHAITWGNGSVGFGVNRRGAGVVDHDLPVMQVADAAGNTKAIITSYAAHAVTLNPADNLVSGDWPGYARQAIEQMYPGAMALVMIGAAGDINPSPMGSTASAQSQGQSVANEVQRLVSGNLMTPVSQRIGAAHGEVVLPFATEREPGDPFDARLAPGPGQHQYGITSWTFGDDIAMVFMEGEVTVDYSLRLKTLHNDGRMWVNAYTNDVQGYIPSERILYEGGYEADGSGFYYALPGRFAHGLEDKIVSEIGRQLEPFFNPLDRLRLRIDRGTGRVSIVNEWEESLALDAYTIESIDGLLGGDWNSLADQGLPGWDEADNSSPHRLTEFNPHGAAVVGAGATLALGRPLSFPVPSRLGEPVADAELGFEYHSPGDEVIQGRVEFVGSPARHNNLVLTIDPDTGEAAIQNESPYFDAEIDGYTIQSISGRLQSDDGGWNSFADQNLAGWDEADNSNAFRVTEFNPLRGETLVQGSAAIELGALVDAAGEGLNVADFFFEFSLASGESLQGVVEFGTLPIGSLRGDYDKNGIVNIGDFDTWKSAFGQAVTPGNGADGNRDGRVDAADYVVWRKNFAAASTLSTTVVPEPSAAALAAAIIIVIAAATARTRIAPSPLAGM